jgi:hypothetical protein
MNGLLSKYEEQDGNEILLLGRVETFVRGTRSVLYPSAVVCRCVVDQRRSTTKIKNYRYKKLQLY